MERRRFARVKVSMMLKFKSLEAFEGIAAGSAGDLSQGGTFIHTKKVRKVGTPVEIELPVDDGETVMIRGIVRSIRYDKNEPSGMGIEFVDLDDRAGALIKSLLDKHK